MRINPGRLREVVQLQQLVTATDAVGNQTADWADSCHPAVPGKQPVRRGLLGPPLHRTAMTRWSLSCAGARCWPLPWRTVT